MFRIDGGRVGSSRQEPKPPVSPSTNLTLFPYSGSGSRSSTGTNWVAPKEMDSKIGGASTGDQMAREYIVGESSGPGVARFRVRKMLTTAPREGPALRSTAAEGVGIEGSDATRVGKHSLPPASDSPSGYLINEKAQYASTSASYRSFPYENVSLTNGASNLKSWIDVFGNLSNSSTLPVQMEIMTTPHTINGFHPSFGVVPNVPQQTFVASSPLGLCNGYFIYNHQVFGDTTYQKVNVLNASQGLSSTNPLKFEGLTILVRKELSKSDVGNTARIVLPKREAEENLPHLEAKIGIALDMKDIKFPFTWKFRYRFWPNNNTKMFVIENTGEFVKQHGLQEGDIFIIYKNKITGAYIVGGEKISKQPNSEVVMNGECEDRRHQMFNDSIKQLAKTHKRRKKTKHQVHNE